MRNIPRRVAPTRGENDDVVCHLCFVFFFLSLSLSLFFSARTCESRRGNGAHDCKEFFFGLSLCYDAHLSPCPSRHFGSGPNALPSLRCVKYVFLSWFRVRLVSGNRFSCCLLFCFVFLFSWKNYGETDLGPRRAAQSGRRNRSRSSIERIRSQSRYGLDPPGRLEFRSVHR